MTKFLKRALTVSVAALSITGLSFSQEDSEPPAKPMYVTLPPRPSTDARPAATLQTWNGSFTYKGKSYTYNMVGTAPSTNTTTTVPVFLIPLKVVITASNGTKTTFDPAHVLTNGKTVTQNTVASPIFDSTTTYVQGGVDVGTTQYIDAFQRANFWGMLPANSTYHLLLGK